MFSLFIGLGLASVSVQAATPPTIYPSELVRWSPDLPVFAYSGFVRNRNASCKVRALYIHPDDGSNEVFGIQEPFEVIRDPEGVLEDEYICHDIMAFGWGENGLFYYVTRESDGNRADFVLNRYQDGKLKELKRYTMSVLRWQNLYAIRVMFGGSHLLFCVNQGDQNLLGYVDLSKDEFDIDTLEMNQKFHNIRSMTSRQIPGKTRVVFSAKTHQDARYKLYTFDITSPFDLKRVVSPSRVTRGAEALNEHFPKLDVSGENLVYYGIEGSQNYSAVYTSPFPTGTPRRVDQLKSGIQQGLLDTNAEATYCWSADGTTLFYIVRSDEKNDPVMYRSYNLKSNEKRLDSKNIHRLVDISPLTGRMAVMVYKVIDGQAQEHPIVRDPGIPAKSFPTFTFHIPEEVKPFDISLGGRDARHYIMKLVEGAVRLKPMTQEKIKNGRALDLQLMVAGRQFWIHNNENSEIDLREDLAGLLRVKVDMRKFADLAFDNGEGELVIYRRKLSRREVLDILGNPDPSLSDLVETNHGYLLKLNPDLKRIDLKPEAENLDLRVSLAGQMAAAPSPLPLKSNYLQLEFKPRAHLLKINAIPEDSLDLDTKDLIPHVFRATREEFEGQVSRLRVYNNDASLEFPILENLDTSRMIIRSIMTGFREEKRRTEVSWNLVNGVYLMKIQVKGS
ncbi:hypothetical protein [Sulfidibacter corallicola]|uniref:Uncharacterized protein n=1 Tax=Sulfidibacter corallicola TaxID=2818388 RepID=A0A8A4TY60_SULCO|nr:hypothetical protein [Sulfidibacter corallicola]QTD54024.1 hypothetical protein J3U87_16380 [Sulfidibacter corallicola]